MDDFTKILLWGFGIVLFLGAISGGGEEAKNVSQPVASKAHTQPKVKTHDELLDEKILHHKRQIDVLLTEAERVLED